MQPSKAKLETIEIGFRARQRHTPSMHLYGRGILTFIVAAWVICLPICTKAMGPQTQPQLLNQALLEAIRHNDTGRVAALLDEGADANAGEKNLRSGRGRSQHVSSTLPPLMVALLPRRVQDLATQKWHWYEPPENLALIQTLLDHGAHVNARALYQMLNHEEEVTPLVCAIKYTQLYSKYATAQLLLGHGANPNVMTGILHSTGCLTSISVPSPLLHYLIRYYPEYKDNVTGTALLEDMLAHGADIERRDGLGNTPLLWAVQNGRVDMLGILLNYHANVNARDRDHETAMMCAIADSDVEILRLLLSYHADVNLKDRHGDTALDYALDCEQTQPLPQIVSRLQQIVSLLKQAGSKERPGNRSRPKARPGELSQHKR